MEIAIEHTNTGIRIYVEGISWSALSHLFREESVNVYKLEFSKNGQRLGCDDRYMEDRGDRLCFFRQNMPVSTILDVLIWCGLGEPAVACLGNSRFLMNRIFRDAYEFRFWDMDEVKMFLHRIQVVYFLGVNKGLEKGWSCSTAGLNDDYVLSPDLDRLMDRRFNNWKDDAESSLLVSHTHESPRI
jgi:hypothetical protein